MKNIIIICTIAFITLLGTSTLNAQNTTRNSGKNTSKSQKIHPKKRKSTNTPPKKTKANPKARSQNQYPQRNDKAPHRNNVILSTRPLSLLTLQPNLKFEYGLNNGLSLGTHATYYTGLNEGFKIDPFARFYPGNKRAPEGLYFQIKGSVGRHDKMLDQVRDDLLDELSTEFEQAELEEAVDALIASESGQSHFTAVGGGIALGHQWLLGRNEGFVIDLYAGYRMYKSTNYKLADTYVFNATRNIPVELGFQIGIAF